MVENIVVRFRDNNPVFINGAISLEEKYYVNMPQPIIVALGKKYLNKNNQEVVIVSEGKKVYEAVIIGKGSSYCVHEDGTAINVDLDYSLSEEIDD